MADKNPCAVPGCEAGAKPGHLMCLDHWRLVPRTIQASVNKTWRAYQRARDTAALDAYRAARDAAVRAVEGEVKQARMF